MRVYAGLILGTDLAHNWAWKASGIVMRVRQETVPVLKHRKSAMSTELYIAVMAGVVLSLFLMVGEIVFMRKRVARIRTRLVHFYQSGRVPSFLAGIFAIVGFFLLQPVIIGYLVVMALDGVDPNFSISVIRQMRQVLTMVTG